MRVVDVLDVVARRAAALLSYRDRAVVGIDGPDAAGKTTFADRLAERLDGSVIRASIDDFHHPAAVRSRRGGTTQTRRTR